MRASWMTTRRLAISLASGAAMFIAFAGATLASETASSASGGAAIALILDASGSMNEKMGDGGTKLDAAKNAVLQLVGTLPKDTRMSFQTYGLEHGLNEHQCDDNQKLVDYGSLADNGPAIAAATRSLVARGYTPITRALTLAAEDIAGEEASNRVIILVSDGKETCKADPCEAAQALAAADAKLTIDTVGFGVDDPAREQLKCVAKAGRGKYFDAKDADGLTKVLAQATVVTKKLFLKYSGIGTIKFKNYEHFSSSGIYIFIMKGEAESGDKFRSNAAVSEGGAMVSKVKPGSYTIRLGNSTSDLHNVVVENDKVTTVEIGVIEFKNGGSLVKITDQQTGELVDLQVSGTGSDNSRFSQVAPGEYKIVTDHVTFEHVKVGYGEHKVMAAALVRVKKGAKQDFTVKPANGGWSETLTPGGQGIAVPAGKYLLSNGDQETPFDLAEGQNLELDVGE